MNCTSVGLHDPADTFKDLPANDATLLLNLNVADPVKNEIAIMPQGSVLWNGAPVDLIRLRQYLEITTTMNPVPELHLKPDPNARYELVDEVLAVTKRANVTKMGFVGNEAYSTF